MTYEEQAREFWWCATMLRKKNDPTSLQALETLSTSENLPPKLRNRVVELKYKHGAKSNGNDGPPLRTA